MKTFIPTSRLLFWTAAVLIPSSAMAAIPDLTLSAITIMSLLTIAVLSDALISMDILEGVRVEFPEIVRLSRNREAAILFRIYNERMRIQRLRIGLSFPSEIQTDSDQWVHLPAQTPSASIEWRCTARIQGQYQLDACYLETQSVMGLWSRRAVMPLHTEIRVYPDLFSDRKSLSALFRNRGIGVHTQRQIGKGRDFEQLREYLPGDGYEDIHWKATAKRSIPITKVYQIERTQEIYVMVDASRLSARRHAQDTVLDRFLTAALTIGLAAEQQGDLFGVLAFTDRVQRFVRAGSGKKHYSTCRDALYTLTAVSVSPDFSELFTFIGSHLRRRALVIMLTSLDDPVLAENVVKNTPMICRRHLLLINMIRPEPAKPLFASSDVHNINDLYRRLGGHFLWTSLQETQNKLKHYGVGFALLDNEKMCVELVGQYLSVKKRQAL